MKKLFIGIFILLLVGVGGYLYRDKILGSKAFQVVAKSSGSCAITNTKGKIISPEIAEVAASKHVQATRKSFDWNIVGYYPIYTSTGEINYYAFIFRKSDFTKFKTLEALEANAQKYSNSTSDAIRYENKYQFSNIETVLTGTHENESIVIRHFNGIPEFAARKLEMKELVENARSGMTIGDLIMDGPMSAVYFEINSKSSGRPNGEVANLFDSKILSKQEIVKQRDALAARLNLQYMRYSSEQCKQLQEGTIQTEMVNKEKWSKY